MIGTRRLLACAATAGVLLLTTAPALAASTTSTFTPDAWFQPTATTGAANIGYPGPVSGGTTWGSTVVVYWSAGTATTGTGTTGTTTTTATGTTTTGTTVTGTTTTGATTGTTIVTGTTGPTTTTIIGTTTTTGGTGATGSATGATGSTTTTGTTGTPGGAATGTTGSATGATSSTTTTGAAGAAGGAATGTVSGVGAGSASAGNAGTPAAAGASGEPGNLSADSAEIEAWTNAIRAQNGLPPLADNALLDKIALLKCQDMLANNYFGDNSPTYGTPLQMQQAFGVQARIMGAENLAGAATTALAWFLLIHSPGHLANILYNGLTDQGAAVVPYGVYGVYVCQEFIGN